MEIAGFGDCLFRAVSDQTWGSQDHHLHLRRIAVDFMRAKGSDFKNFILDEEEGGLEGYCSKMNNEREWGGHPEIIALCHHFQRPARIYTPSFEPVSITHGAWLNTGSGTSQLKVLFEFFTGSSGSHEADYSSRPPINLFTEGLGRRESPGYNPDRHGVGHFSSLRLHPSGGLDPNWRAPPSPALQ